MKTCTFEDCPRPAVAKSLCNSHWAQQNRGKPLTPIRTSESPDQRFQRNIRIDPKTKCWIWTGAGSGKFYDKASGEGGYGMLRVHGKSWMAHRYAYEQAHGVQLSPDDTLDHLCRVTRCCNPDHLERVTRSENKKRRHLYQALRAENDRLRAFIASIGYDADRLPEDPHADIPALPKLS